MPSATWYWLYLAACLPAVFATLLLTLYCRRQAGKWGLVDKPKNEKHKNHRQPTPVAGGIAMCAGWLLTLGGGLAGSRLLLPHLPDGGVAILAGMGSVRTSLAVTLGGALLLTVIGVADDRRAMSAGAKFSWQFAVALATAVWGPRLTALCPYPWLSILLTVLWIMTVINALNFFDNMDGLAGGTAAIAAFFLFVIAAWRGQHFVAMLSVVTFGCALGFLVYNRPPARIFMGDGGSHFLGYCLAVACILTTFYRPGESLSPAPLLIPLMVLAVPLFDAAAVVMIRLRLRQPIYVGDNRHLSHRFVRLGLTRPQAVLVIWLLCLVTGCGAVALLWLPPLGAALIFAQCGATLAVISILQFYIPEARKCN